MTEAAGGKFKNNMKKKILFIFGTRPEAIKLAPVILELKRDKTYNVKVCVTAQHREMLDQVLSFFKIKPDFDLNIMVKNQSLFSLTSVIIKKIEKVFNKVKPDIIFVQGDTSSAFTGALAGYYSRIKVVHIEAGLRSYRKYSPFPEEMNRVLVDHIANIHFAPTNIAVKNLKKEGIKKNVFQVGNTVIDALYSGMDILNKNKKRYQKQFSFLHADKKVILATATRRESFGKTFDNICYALKQIALNHKDDIQIIYPVHLNPNIQKSVNKILKNIPNIFLIKPLDYPSLLYLIKRCYLIVTDSGGIQEEALCMGKPVLVIRDVTERVEGIKAGTAKLIGTDKNNIIKNIKDILNDKKKYIKMSNAKDLYGNGKSSIKIKKIIKRIV